MGVCLIRGTTGEHDQLIKANKTEMRKRGIECFALDKMMIMRLCDNDDFQSHNIQIIDHLMYNKDLNISKLKDLHRTSFTFIG